MKIAESKEKVYIYISASFNGLCGTNVIRSNYLHADERVGYWYICLW